MTSPARTIDVVLVVAFGDLAVVELNAIGLRAVLAKHDDLVAVGELGQALRAREAARAPSPGSSIS